MRRSLNGFTLIELLTTITVLAILASLAVPSLRSFLLKNKVASISNEFSGALQQTRALAISKNSCATLCASTNITTGNAGTCSNGTTDDFQAGWIIFVNPACDATQTDPTAAGGALNTGRVGEAGSGYSLKPSTASLSIVMFDPRGYANLSAAGRFQVTTPGDIAQYRRTVCLDAAGRPTVRSYTTTCTN